MGMIARNTWLLSGSQIANLSVQNLVESGRFTTPLQYLLRSLAMLDFVCQLGPSHR
jgi:hypothetical protein